MSNYSERLLDRKIEKKLKSTGGILLKGVRFAGKQQLKFGKEPFQMYK